MRALLALFLLSLTASAHAQSLGANDRSEWNPPARYDGSFHGTLTEHRLQQQAVRRYCLKLRDHYAKTFTVSEHSRGCAVLVAPDHCVIAYIDRPYGLATPEAVLRHELGHCNGWPADHPN